MVHCGVLCETQHPTYQNLLRFLKCIRPLPSLVELSCYVELGWVACKAISRAVGLHRCDGSSCVAGDCVDPVVGQCALCAQTLNPQPKS
jgi:hypothetical protein